MNYSNSNSHPTNNPEIELSLALKMNVDCDSIEHREVMLLVQADIIATVWDRVSDNESSHAIGTIDGYKFSTTSMSDILDAADNIGGNLYDAIVWIDQQIDITAIMAESKSMLYLDAVFIEPDWCDRNVVLSALASFLQVIANEGFVFLHPFPLTGDELSEVELQQQKLLQRFWRRLGINNCDRKENIMWEPKWTCPSWLKAKL